METITRQKLKAEFSRRLVGLRFDGYTIVDIEMEELSSFLHVHVIGNGFDNHISVGLGDSESCLTEEALDLFVAEIVSVVEGDEDLKETFSKGDFDSIRDKVRIFPNSIKSRRLPPLADIPYLQIGDIVFTYMVTLSQPPAETSGWESHLTLTNRMIDRFGLSRIDIHTDALKNTMLAQKPYFKTLGEKVGMDESKENEINPLHVYVAGTHPDPYGSVVLLYPGFMEMAANRLDGNFYILPASVHELLFLSDISPFTVDELEDLVQGINRKTVPPEFFHSDNVYFYDAETKEIRLARK